MTLYLVSHRMIRASGKEWLSHINITETFWILAKTYADCISTIHAVEKIFRQILRK